MNLGLNILFKIFLVLVLAFQPYVYASTQVAPSYNQEASEWLTRTQHKSDAIMLVEDFNADPNALDENGDTVLVKALRGELSNENWHGATYSPVKVAFSLVMLVMLGATAMIGITIYDLQARRATLIEIGTTIYDLQARRATLIENRQQRMEELFQEWEDSGANRQDLHFYRLFLNGIHASSFNDGLLLVELRNEAREINARNKELVPDELLFIIEEYIRYSEDILEIPHGR